MEKYYVISPKKGKFCPMGLSEGILHTEFNPANPFNPLPTDSGEWRKYVHGEVELPSQCWFVTTDKRYEFDYRWDSGGFIFSARFVDLLCQSGVTNFQTSPLEFVNKHKQSVSSMKYYYTKFFAPLSDKIDYELSKIDFRKDNSIKKVWRLILKGSDYPSVFVLSGSIFFNALFCTEDFMVKMGKLKFRGVECIPTEEFGRFNKF